MTKKTSEIDSRNPFIPSQSKVCRIADTVLIFSIAAVGLVAAAIVLLQRGFAR